MPSAQSLELCDSPPRILNVTGRETLRVVRGSRQCIWRRVRRAAGGFIGHESGTALLSNAAECFRVFRPLTARKALLSAEKEATRLRDKINAQRSALPWVKVEKTYLFDTPNGKKTLADLFGSRSQLIVYHFMLGPGWTAGCPGCSFLSDHIDGAMPHLEHHDVTMIAVSRAPLAEIEAYKSRMGWQFLGCRLPATTLTTIIVSRLRRTMYRTTAFPANYTDMPVKADSGDTEMPGLSAFYKDEAGTVFHTYSTRAAWRNSWAP